MHHRGTALLATFAALSASSVAAAKATTVVGSADGFEALIMHIDTSENPGDTDVNFVLVPPSIDKAQAFWDAFWPHVDQDWVDALARVVSATRGRYGKECTSRVGTGADGTACVIEEGRAYMHHPCPRLLGTPACLDDIAGVTSTELDDLTVKAEIFVNDPGDTHNSKNAALAFMTTALGLPGDDCELSTQDGNALCGHKIAISGPMMLDQQHNLRPEVHPIERILVDRGLSGNGARTFRLGAFVDGSTDGPWPWMADYHEVVRMPAVATFDTSLFPWLSPQPLGWVGIATLDTVDKTNVLGETQTAALDPSCANPLRLKIKELDGKIALLEKEKEQEKKEIADARDHIGPGNQGGISKPEAAREMKETDDFYAKEEAPLRKERQEAEARLAQCPKSLYRTIDVTLNTTDPGGAYWVGNAVVGWEPAGSFSLSASLLGSAGGYLSPTPPDAAHLPPTPPRIVRGALPGPACVVPPGARRAPGLKRWFGYKVKTASTFKVPAPWTWSAPAGAALSPAPPKAAAASEEVLWVPSSTKSPELKVTASPVGSTPVWRSEPLATASPRARVEIVQDALAIKPEGRIYTAKIAATTSALCGDPSTFSYTWLRDGRPVAAWTGPGPFEVSLKPGERATVEVVVGDAFGVEKAVDARVLAAPELDVRAETSCAPGRTSRIDWTNPRGWPAGAAAKGTLCTTTVVNAVASGALGERSFPAADMGKLTFAWSDLKIATADAGWQWRAPPAGWKVSPLNAQSLEVAASPPVFFELAATVTVTDAYGNKASAHVRTTNDGSSATDLRKQIAQMWSAWRPGQPLPRSDAGPDPLAHKVAGVLLGLAQARPDNARDMMGARHGVQGLRVFGFEVVGKDKGIPVTKTPPPSFATRATSPARVEALTGEARAAAKKRAGLP